MSKFERDVREYLKANNIQTTYDYLTSREKLDYWLKWNGIIGYTEDIVMAIYEFYGTPLPPTL